jgi:hypothetical protein
MEAVGNCNLVEDTIEGFRKLANQFVFENQRFPAAFDHGNSMPFVVKYCWYGHEAREY